MEPAAVAAFDSEKPLLAARPLGSMMTGGWPPLAGSGASPVPGRRKPPEARRVPSWKVEKPAQLMPLW